MSASNIKDTFFINLMYVDKSLLECKQINVLSSSQIILFTSKIGERRVVDIAVDASMQLDRDVCSTKTLCADDYRPWQTLAGRQPNEFRFRIIPDGIKYRLTKCKVYRVE